MSGKILMCAPEMDLYVSRYHASGLDSKPIPLCEEGEASFSELLKEIKQIAPLKEDPLYWSFFFPVPRGSLSQFMRYDDWFEPEETSKEEYEEAFARRYPNKHAWYEMKVVEEEGYAALWVDDACFARRNPREKASVWTHFPLNRMNAYLLQVVKKVVRMLKEGTYNDYVEKNLPYEYREGKIKRSLYWRLVKGSKKNQLEGLKRKEVEDFLRYGKELVLGEYSQRLPTSRLSSLTAGRYYEICSICYKGAHFKDLEGRSPKQMFEKYGDDRDGGLSTIDEGSSEEFERWLSLSVSEKWEIENPSHMWEIVEGSSHTRIHLFPRKCDDGYYFLLSGGLHCCTEESVRMFNALCANSIPVSIYDYDLIEKKLEGEDDLGIICFKEDGWAYWYGGFQEGSCVNFVRLEDGSPSEVRAKATWFPLRKLTLASD